MLIKGFAIQILLPKSKEDWTEVISRLLSTFVTFVTQKLQEHLNFSIHFLNFFSIFSVYFQYIALSIHLLSNEE